MRGRQAGGRTQAPRRVWHNPVAWREAVTRASALNRGIARFFLLGGGVVAGLILLIVHLSGGTGVASVTRDWLSTLVLIEFATVLILACNTAAMAITKERESRTLDILLTTPLQPRDLVWGKLRGLVSFAVPMLAVPVGTVLVFALVDLIRGQADVVVNVEAALYLGLLMTLFVALACVLSMRISLRSRQTVQAVMVSAGVLILGYALLSMLVNFTVVATLDEGGAFFGPISPYTAVITLVDAPGLFENNVRDYLAAAATVRLNALGGTLLAVAAYAGLVYFHYTSMVREFDMTLRKQTGT
jgi:ABC-type transport system involved in multi-copper enzyme maturation permease subunit